MPGTPFDLDLPTRLLDVLMRLQKPFERMTPADFALYNERQGRSSWIARLFTGREIPLDEVRETNVPTRGGRLRVRVYAPERAATLPALLYFHGGGFVLGGIEAFDHVARAIARTASMRVVSVDYRLAPKHRFPAAVHDAEDVLAWLVERAGSRPRPPASTRSGRWPARRDRTPRSHRGRSPRRGSR